jgi:hypothetical protein
VGYPVTDNSVVLVADSETVVSPPLSNPSIALVVPRSTASFLTASISAHNAGTSVYTRDSGKPKAAQLLSELSSGISEMFDAPELSSSNLTMAANLESHTINHSQLTDPMESKMHTMNIQTAIPLILTDPALATEQQSGLEDSKPLTFSIGNLNASKEGDTQLMAPSRMRKLNHPPT